MFEEPRKGAVDARRENPDVEQLVVVGGRVVAFVLGLGVKVAAVFGLVLLIAFDDNLRRIQLDGLDLGLARLVDEASDGSDAYGAFHLQRQRLDHAREQRILFGLVRLLQPQ